MEGFAHDAGSHSPWRAFQRSLIHFDSGKLDIGMAMRNALAVALPLCAGAAWHRPLPALIAATGALNVCFADGSDPRRQRLRRMLGAAALVGLAVFCGGALGGTLPGALASAALWAFATAILLALGQAAGNVGVSSLSVLLIYAARPMPPHEAALAGCLALGGGIVAAAISLLAGPWRGVPPEREALASLYLELAAIPARPVRTDQPPAGSRMATLAREAVDPLASTHTLQGERYRALLDQGERTRVSLLTLQGLREAARRNPKGAALAAILDAFLTAAAEALQAIGQILRTGQSIETECHPAARALALLAEFRRRPPDAPMPVLAADIQAQMDALARQLRVTFDLANHATPAGLIEFTRREAAQPWQLRVGSSLAAIRTHLTMRSAVFRHAIRLAACIVVGDALAIALAHERSWSRPYWLPLTVAVVLKPDFSSTFSRGVQRLGGTFLGLGLATALFHLLPERLAVEIALITVATFFLRWAGLANYGLLAVSVSSLVVLLVAITGVSPAGVIAARAENTALGGVLALLAYWLWPTWERTQVREAFARLFESYRAHWMLLGRAYMEGDAPEIPPAMDRKRLEARLARSNVEASVDRLAAEPGTPPRQRDRWNAMLASSHIFAHSAIMLEASRLVPSGPLASHQIADPAYGEFIEQVGRTFELLAVQLRGREAGAYPDLREAHHRLVDSAGTPSGRHTLISLETDKIVNSLNTLREQVQAASN